VTTFLECPKVLPVKKLTTKLGLMTKVLDYPLKYNAQKRVFYAKRFLIQETFRVTTRQKFRPPYSIAYVGLRYYPVCLWSV